METRAARLDTDPSTPHPSAFDGGRRPDDDVEADVLFPDALRPRSYQDPLPRGDERDVVEQRAPVAVPDDAEDERRD